MGKGVERLDIGGDIGGVWRWILLIMGGIAE